MADKNYIRKIMKRLKCSKGKRMEIKKDLTMDILAAEENGENWEDIKKRMGDPEGIAAEFNSNFSEEERKKYKKEKSIKRTLSVVCVIILILAAGFYWVVPKSIPIEQSKIFSEKEIVEKAEDIIRLVEAGDYEALRESAIQKLGPAIKEEVLEGVKNSLGSDWGSFQSFGNYYIAEIKQMGKRTGVIQLNASYENTSITYTISFNEDMKLIGLYLK